MRKRILIAALLSAISGLVCAQSPPTVINAPVIVSGPSPSGNITISWTRAENDAVPRIPVFPGSKIIQIVNGQISTSLLPTTVQLPPGLCYQIAYSLSNGQRFTRYWSVPVSATPITNLSTIEGSVPCATNGGALVAPGQIAAGGAKLNQILTYNGSYWGPANSQGGGGGGSTLLPYTLCASSCDGTIGASPLTILATTHKQGNNAFGIFWDNSTPAQEVLPKVEAGTTLGDLKITYSGTLSRIEIFGGSSQGGGGAAGGTSGQLQINSLGSFGGFTLGGDCILTQPNMICTKTNGVFFATSATTDTTNASNIISGTLAAARGGTGAGSFTSGSVVFASGGLLAQDNANLFYNLGSHLLQSSALEVTGTATIDTTLVVAGTTNLSGAQVTGPNSGINFNTEIRMIDPAGTTSLFGCNHTDPTLHCYASDTPTDTNNRFAISGNGAMTWGPGNTASDTNLYRLGVGQLQTEGQLRLLASGLNASLVLQNIGTSGRTYTIFSSDNSAGILGTGNLVVYDNVASAPRFAIAPSGNLLIGGVVDGNYSLDVQTSGSGGAIRAPNALFFNSTPTTGVTSITLQAGAGQSSNRLLSVTNNASVATAAIFGGGDINAPSFNAWNTSFAIKGSLNPAVGAEVSSDRGFMFSSTIASDGSPDTGLSRISAALVGIGNGTHGDFSAGLKAASIVVAAVTNSALTSGRVVFSTTAGLETDSANLTFNGTNLAFPTATVNSLVASVGINPSVAGGIPLGTNALPFSSVYIGAAATNNARITGTMTAARTITIPDASITLAGDTVTFCGTTTTCSATNISTTAKVVSGQVALSSGTPSTAVVISIPAYTSTTSYACSATNMTTAANSIKVVNTSTTSITLTGPNTVTDNVSYLCSGS